MHSFEVEEVKKIKGDWLLDIDVLPNRGPDCFSHFGIAREIATIIESKIKRLTKYYKKAGKLPSEWKYDAKRASMFVS